MDKNYFVYIITNKNNNVLYTGITNNLIRRIYEHKKKIYKGFSAKYNLNKLIYFEYTDDVNEAIKREKQIKGGSRKKKLDMINSMNPNWKDLYDEM